MIVSYEKKTEINVKERYFSPHYSETFILNSGGDKGCHGAPDWIIEIVSLSSKKLDYVIKLAEYQKAGVREYWNVDPFNKIIMVYQLEKGDAPIIYQFTDNIPVGIYDDFSSYFAEIELPEFND